MTRTVVYKFLLSYQNVRKNSYYQMNSYERMEQQKSEDATRHEHSVSNIDYL